MTWPCLSWHPHFFPVCLESIIELAGLALWTFKLSDWHETNPTSNRRSPTVLGYPARWPSLRWRDQSQGPHDPQLGVSLSWIDLMELGWDGWATTERDVSWCHMQPCESEHPTPQSQANVFISGQFGGEVRGGGRGRTIVFSWILKNLWNIIYLFFADSTYLLLFYFFKKSAQKYQNYPKF